MIWGGFIIRGVTTGNLVRSSRSGRWSFTCIVKVDRSHHRCICSASTNLLWRIQDLLDSTGWYCVNQRALPDPSECKLETSFSLTLSSIVQTLMAQLNPPIPIAIFLSPLSPSTLTVQYAGLVLEPTLRTFSVTTAISALASPLVIPAGFPGFLAAKFESFTFTTLPRCSRPRKSAPGFVRAGMVSVAACRSVRTRLVKINLVGWD